MALIKLYGWFSFTLLILLGCGVHRPVLLSEGPVAQLPKFGGQGTTYLTGSLPTTEGKTLSLDSLKERSIVLIFASDTCDICLSEAEEFRDSLKDPTVAPTHVELLSVLVGTRPKDVQFWKEDNRIPWRVGWDETLELYQKYCGNSAAVPCTIVQTPEKGIVYQHIGKTALKDILKLTGAWESL